MSLLNNPPRSYGVPSEDSLGAGLEKDDDQKLTVKLTGPFFFSPAEEIDLHFDADSLEVTSLSPRTLRAKVTPKQVEEVHTMIVQESVRSTETRDTLTAVAAAVVSAQAEIDAAELLLPVAKGYVTLVAGVATITVTGVAATWPVSLTRTTGAGTLGALYDVTFSADTVTITALVAVAGATQVLDTSTFSYLVWRP